MRRRTITTMVMACLGMLFVLGNGSAVAAQDPPATVEFVDGRYFTPTELTVSAVNPDGTVGATLDPDTYSYELDEFDQPDRLTITAGCYRISLTGISRFKSPLTEQWAACLDAGESSTFYPGVQERISAGRGVQSGFVSTPDGTPVPGVTVELYFADFEQLSSQAYYFLDSDQAAAARVGPPGITLSTAENGGFFTLLSSGVPSCGIATYIAPDGFVFPTGTEYHRPLCGDNFATIISPVGQADPGRGLLDIGPPVDSVLRHRAVITSVATGQVVGGHSVGVGNSIERLPVIPGCYQVAYSLESTDRVWAETTQVAGVDREVCVEADGQKVTEVPPTRLLSWDAGQPVLPGVVQTANGSGVSRVQVDYFWPADGVSDDELRAADHRSRDYRGDYYASATTDGGGNYRQAVFASCLVVTYIAPDGFGFDGERYLNQTRCQGDGNSPVIIQSDDGPPAGRVSGVVINTDGGPVGGVTVDYFSPADGVTDDEILNGNHQANDYRGSYLSTVFTGTDGRFDQAAEGCVVLTYIAPAGYRFETGRYFRQGACGDQPAADVIILGDRPEAGAIAGTVGNGDQPISGVKADLFDASADGSRAGFLGDVSTDDAGVYRFSELEPRCYIIVLVAPDEFVFEETGSKYLQRGRCVTAGQTADGPDGTLIPS